MVSIKVVELPKYTLLQDLVKQKIIRHNELINNDYKVVALDTIDRFKLKHHIDLIDDQVRQYISIKYLDGIDFEILFTNINEILNYEWRN